MLGSSRNQNRGVAGSRVKQVLLLESASESLLGYLGLLCGNAHVYTHLSAAAHLPTSAERCLDPVL
jgi:hypothetical protein